MTMVTRIVQIATVFSLLISGSLFHDGFLLLYSPLQMILAFHLLIIQAYTWVSVPLDTLSGVLWVIVANVALFRGPVHINAAKKLTAGHSMRWQQLSLRYFWVPILLVHSCSGGATWWPRGAWASPNFFKKMIFS